MSASHHWHDFDRGHLKRAALRIGLAGALVVGLHSAALYAGLFKPEDEVAAMDEAAIMIELAALPTTAPSEQDVAPGPEMQQSLAEPTPDAPDIPDDAAPPPEPVVEQVIEKLPELTPTPTKTEVVLPKPEPEKKQPDKPKPKQVERPKPDSKPTRRQRAPTTAAAPRSEAATAQATAAPSAGAATSNSVNIADWKARVRGRIVSQKRYPPGATPGTPSIAFDIGSGGQLLGVRLTRSSGSSVLDNEALAMTRRAAPFPPPPPGVSGAMTLAINFTR